MNLLFLYIVEKVFSPCKITEIGGNFIALTEMATV